MDETSIVILVTIITTVLPVLWAVFGWLARRSWRPVLRGLGLALVPIGLLTWIGAGFMTPLTREEARQRRAEHRERRAAGAAGKPTAPASQASQARTDKAPRTAPTASRRSGMSPEDEELEKILKDRGI